MRTFLVVVALLAVLIVGGVVALGYSRGWFSVAVNREKMKEDTDEAKDKLEGLGKQIKDKVGETTDKAGTQSAATKTASGKVTKLEAADSRFLMTTADNGELTVYTNSSSALQRNGQPAGLADLRVGDKVEVNYTAKDGKDLATSVTAQRD